MQVHRQVYQQDHETGIESLADEITGVEQTSDNGESTGVVEPTGVDFNTKPTGVEVEADHSDVHEPVPQEHEEMYQGDEMDGLGQQVPTPEPISEPSSLRRSSRLTKNWKQSYIPNYKGTKYNVVLTQVTKLLQGSKNATSLAQMSSKLMSKGVHRKADTVGAIMAQLSMKAAIKKWRGDADLAIPTR